MKKKLRYTYTRRQKRHEKWLDETYTKMNNEAFSKEMADKYGTTNNQEEQDVLLKLQQQPLWAYQKEQESRCNGDDEALFEIVNMISIKTRVAQITVRRILKMMELYMMYNLRRYGFCDVFGLGRFTLNAPNLQDELYVKKLGKYIKLDTPKLDFVYFKPYLSFIYETKGVTAFTRSDISEYFNAKTTRSNIKVEFQDIINDVAEKDNELDTLMNIISLKGCLESGVKRPAIKDFQVKNDIERKNRQNVFKRYKYSLTGNRRIYCVETNIIYPSIRSAASELGLNFNNLYAHTSGVTHDMSYNNYHFKWVDLDNNFTEADIRLKDYTIEQEREIVERYKQRREQTKQQRLSNNNKKKEDNTDGKV